MEEKKKFSEKLSEFFAGKGFYIVLLLCAALIGTSIWLMADGSRADVEISDGETVQASTSANENQREDAVPAMQVEATPKANTPQRAATPAPEEPAIVPEPPAVATEPAKDDVPNPDAKEQNQPTVAADPVDYFIWPVNGTLARAHSVEALSYDPTMADWRVHDGWDIAAEPGAQVLSTANGTVSAVYENQLMGHVVEVSHSNGLVSVYANLAPEVPVSVGQIVSVGSVLGTVGCSALSEIGQVDHLHFAMRMGEESVDPGDWLPKP